MCVCMYVCIKMFLSIKYVGGKIVDLSVNRMFIGHDYTHVFITANFYAFFITIIFLIKIPIAESCD